MNAPLNAWELDGMPSMEGEADLYFASSISRFYLSAKICVVCGSFVCPQMTQIFADGGGMAGYE